MPDNPRPPYASGAISIPRTLFRWLDINPQNGPLSRTSTYITLPAFNGNNENWLGYSDIVTSFNFEGPNNFSLVAGSIIPISPNYSLCISYRVGGNLVRYILWLAAGAVMPANFKFYVNQPIKKNFRLEVWSTSQGNATQATPITFYTSVKGQVDYRYGQDTTLVGADAQVSNFSDVANIVQDMVVNVVDHYNIFTDSYNFSGFTNDKPTYNGVGSPAHLIWYDGTQWEITVFLGSGAYYITNNGSQTPSTGNWVTGLGPGPAPTFVSGGTITAFGLPLTFPTNAVSVTN